VSELV